jgi:MFS family permease
LNPRWQVCQRTPERTPRGGPERLLRRAAACTVPPVGPARAIADLLAHGRGRVLLFCWLGWVFDFHDLILFSFVKRSVAADLVLGDDAIAWIEGAGLFASALGAVLFGRVADRIGRRRAMTASIAVYSAGALLTAAAGDGWLLLAARALTGLGVGGEWGIGHAVVAETFAGRDRDRAHGLLQAGSPIAMALAAVTGLFVAPHVGWRWVFAASALPAALVFAARWAMPGPDRAPVPTAHGSGLRALLAPRHRRATLVLFAILLLHMTGFWCVYAELPAALMRDLHVSPTAAGTFQLAVNGVHVAADVAFGWLAARAGRRRMFVLFCAWFALAQLLLAWFWGDLARDFVTFTAAAAAMGVGAGTWSCFGALFGVHYPPALRATAASLLYSVARGAQLFAKPLLAALAAAFGGMQPALWVGAGCALGSALLLRALPRAPAE